MNIYINDLGYMAENSNSQNGGQLVEMGGNGKKGPGKDRTHTDTLESFISSEMNLSFRLLHFRCHSMNLSGN